jgi:hypothetical protein
MELHFPQGSVDKSMSDEMQDQFFEKLKPAVWCILTKINTDQLTATAFCVDPEKMLLLTAAHTFDESWKGDVHVPMETIEVFAQRDLDPDNIMHYKKYHFLQRQMLLPKTQSCCKKCYSQRKNCCCMSLA